MTFEHLDQRKAIVVAREGLARTSELMMEHQVPIFEGVAAILSVAKSMATDFVGALSSEDQSEFLRIEQLYLQYMKKRQSPDFIPEITKIIKESASIRGGFKNPSTGAPK